MGTVKGRIGSNVFYVKQGEQNIIKHQTEVLNPKSSGQCIHRSMFAAAGKFYTHGTQALFKFAFENKKKGESDFNAFMKANVDRAIPMSRQAIDNPQYPMVSNWLVTRGSLPTPTVFSTLSSVRISLPNLNGTTANIRTVAEFSKKVVDGVNYKEGDILTFLYIHSYVGAQSYPAINPDILLQPQLTWTIKQIRLSATDATNLSAFGLSVSQSSSSIMLEYSANNSSWETSFSGSTVIHSRPSAGGLKVSTNSLVVNSNDSWQQPLEAIKLYAATDEYRSLVIPTWQGSSTSSDSTEIILEGALVSKSSITTSGTNPLQATEAYDENKALTLPFDPRSGYLTATGGYLTAAEAIEAAAAGEAHLFYYNRVNGAFVKRTGLEEEEMISVKVGSLGTYDLWYNFTNNLYIVVLSWTNEQGQTVEFPYT